MTEQEWLAGDNIYFMIEYLADKDGNTNRLRLFACACCRRVWGLLTPTAKRIVELSEAHAKGMATIEQLRQADFAEIDMVGHDVQERPSVLVLQANEAARSMVSPKFDVYVVVQDTSKDPATDFVRGFEDEDSGRGVLTLPAEINEKLKLLRDIFGNPFRPVSFKPEWRTPTTLALAEQMYKTRDFSAMPILADALQDAGCESEEILSHCRGEGPHVRGCWVVDLVLSKDR